MDNRKVYRKASVSIKKIKFNYLFQPFDIAEFGQSFFQDNVVLAQSCTPVCSCGGPCPPNIKCC